MEMFKLQIKAEQNSSICVYFEGEYACTRLGFHQQDFLLWISVFFPSLLTFSYFNYSTVVHCGTLWPNLVDALDPGLRGLGPRPGYFIVLCSWTKHFTLSTSLQPGV